MTTADPMKQYRPSSPLAAERAVRTYKEAIKFWQQQLQSGKGSVDEAAVRFNDFMTDPLNFAVALSEVLAEKDPA